MYTIHGEYGAITVDDDQVSSDRDDLVERRRIWRAVRGVQSVPSHWMDASTRSGRQPCSIS